MCGGWGLCWPVSDSPRKARVPVPAKNPGEEPVPQILEDQGDDLDKAPHHEYSDSLKNCLSG